MPPLHRLTLASLALAATFAVLLLMPRPAWPSEGPRWRWPLRGAVVARFRLTPATPFARGQRRGIELAAPAGATVRTACGGRVTFAGPLPRAALAVTVRCGELVATYLHLATLTVHRGARLTPGQRLGGLGPAGRLRLGARRATERRGYIDPLTLLGDPAAAQPPLLGPPPAKPSLRARAPSAEPSLRAPEPSLRTPAPSAEPSLRAPPAPPTRHVPWLAYPALALVATALPVGGLVHRRHRQRAPSVARSRVSAL